MDEKELLGSLDETVPLTKPENFTDEDKQLLERIKNIQIKNTPSVTDTNTIMNKHLADKNRLEKRRAKNKRARAARKRNRK